MATTVIAPSGGIKKTAGTWTHTVGTAAETIGVGGIVFGAVITSVDSSGAFDAEVRYSVSVSGNVSTITFYPLGDVTSGKFLIFHSGS